MVKPRQEAARLVIYIRSISRKKSGNGDGTIMAPDDSRTDSIRGKGLGVSLLMDAEGNCAAQFAHERLREYPITGGPSTIVEVFSPLNLSR